MKKVFILFVLFVFCVSNRVDAQSSKFSIVMNQEQMYQDYDSLVSVVKNGFPEITINKQVYGIDVLKILKDNRKEIALLHTTQDFVLFLGKTLKQLHGSHLWLNTTALPLLNTFSFFTKYASKEDYTITQEYEKLVYTPNNQSKIKLNLFLFEYQGEYYTRSFEYQGEKYEAGLKVIS